MKLFLLLILLPLIWLIISPTVKVSADEVVKGVTIVKPSNTKNEVAKKNINTIIEYFSLYLGDLDKFYSLWVPDEPIVITPLVGEDVAVASVKDHIGWEAVKAFYDPIFQNMKGKFNWTINEFIVSEDPNLIITKSHSDIDVTTSGIFGDKKLKYKGVYVQIFTFENGKVKSFEEYFDTALLNSQYGS
ncbi:MAG: nuclear transport factor 2 family protein [Deltaproteobacteria bacterium]|jgi:ketosteroid isomerase-like protein|nr:nuclear transport factor 2 family protein [Deltaproteobacteria bacterium]